LNEKTYSLFQEGGLEALQAGPQLESIPWWDKNIQGGGGKHK